MSDEIEAAIKAAEELASEAADNGNDWRLWISPRLDLICEALRASVNTKSGSP